MKLDKSFNPYWQHFGTITEPHLRKQKRNSSLKKLTSVDQAPPSGGYFNSPGTEIFPFSYFAFTLLKLRKVIKDIKNLTIFHKTKVQGLDFEKESFLQKSSHDTVITDFILTQKRKCPLNGQLCPGS